MPGRNNSLPPLDFPTAASKVTPQLFSMRVSELIGLDKSILSYQATGQRLGGAVAHGSIGRLTRKRVLASGLCPEQHWPDKRHCNAATMLRRQKGGLNCHNPVPPRGPESLFSKMHVTIPFKEKLQHRQKQLGSKTDPCPTIPFSNKADM